MKSRLGIVLVFLGMWSGAVVWRLYDLQVARHDSYAQRARNQQHRRVTLEPPRGTIYDARGRELALSVAVDSVWADATKIADPRATARKLAAALNVDAGQLAGKLAKERQFVWVARQLDPPDSKAVRALQLEGIHFLQESRRYYPMRERAAQILGFAGIDNEGLAGIERSYDDEIDGQPVEREVLLDARRGTVLSPALSFQDARAGSDLRLTIDATIQNVVERELAAGVAAARAKSGTALLLDPNTGAILAMAAVPTFDPNRFNQFPSAQRRNRALTDAFEPGSTFKVVTAAAALEKGLLAPDDIFDCENGVIHLAGVPIHDHTPFGELTFSEIIHKSSNVGAIKIGLLVGRRDLFDQIEAFGFGVRTGVDLPGESPGILRDVDSWPKRAAAYISFGQGISVTGLQLTSAFAAVANGGRLLEPYVVAQVVDPEDGTSRSRQPTVLGTPIRPETAATLREMLVGVVNEGTGRRAAVDGYQVAGKTGTAQKAEPGRGYSPDKFLASFVGFVPAERPAVVALIAIDEPLPAGGYHGGDVAAPVFSAIMEEVLLYMGVKPEREPNLDWARSETRMARRQDDLGSPGDSKSATASAGTIPDMTGMTAREAVVVAARQGLRVNLRGTGFVSRQNPAPGASSLGAKNRITVWLADEVLKERTGARTVG